MSFLFLEERRLVTNLVDIIDKTDRIKEALSNIISNGNTGYKYIKHIIQYEIGKFVYKLISTRYRI
jgi:hypothetical protein